MNGLKLPLSNVQTELMKLYSTNLSEKEFEELRNILARFYADKAISGANKIWDDRGLTDADMDSWLNKKLQSLLVVVDTNVLLVSVSSRSRYHWLYKLILEKKIYIAFTNDMLAEYEEQIASHQHSDVAANVVRSLIELSTAKLTVTYFSLNLIINDEDDNKFADCAFASNADYIVTNDKDFDVLKQLTFPLLNVVTINEFEEIVTKKKTLP